MFWIKFPLKDIRYYLDEYDDYPICTYNGFGYLFRDNYEFFRFLDRHKEAEIVY